MGIATVAVFSDADVTAPHVAAADEAVRLGPPPVKDSYLSSRRWSPPSSTPAPTPCTRATACSARTAPSPRPSRKPAPPSSVRPPRRSSFRRQVKAREVARSVGVSRRPARPVPRARRRRSCAPKPTDRVPRADQAAGGGGGIGMQVAERADQLEGRRAGADRASRAFGNGSVYLEHTWSARATWRSRSSVSSTARRTTSSSASAGPAPPPEGHRGVAVAAVSSADATPRSAATLHEAAREAARAVGYVARAPSSSSRTSRWCFYFLEINARLQVEHPVTE